MHIRLLAGLLAVAVTAVAAGAGCTLRNATEYDVAGARDRESRPVSSTVAADAPSEEAIALFAPVGMGTLAAFYPEGTSEWPIALASRLNILNRIDGVTVRAYFNQHLPDAASEEWSRGRVPGTRTVRYVVLPQVVGVEESPGPLTTNGRISLFTATASLRVLDQRNVVVYRILGWASEEDIRSPKFNGPVNDPRVKAAKAALTAAVGSFQSWLRGQSDPLAGASALPTVSMAITTDPPGADIIVDGIYRGITPAQIAMPLRATELRIERQGFLPWARTIMPSAEPLHRVLVAPESQK